MRNPSKNTLKRYPHLTCLKYLDRICRYYGVRIKYIMKPIVKMKGCALGFTENDSTDDYISDVQATKIMDAKPC